MPRFETKEGLNINYYEGGKDSGKPIVLIHGLTSNLDTWSNSTKFLEKKGYHLIVPDLRGHGGSDNIEGEYKVSDYSNDIAELTTHLNAKEPVIVGHSWGSLVAMSYTYDNPVSGLVIFSPTYHFDDFPARNLIAPLVKRFKNTPPFLTISNMRKLSGVFSSESKYGKSHRIYGKCGLPGREGTAEFLKALRATDVYKHPIYKGGAPIGLIYGSNEYEWILKQAKEVQENFSKVHTYEIHGGHHVQKEHPHIFNQKLNEYLDAIHYV